MQRLTVLAGALVVTTVAVAHDVRHHGPHVHGQANLAVALEGKELSLELESPGIGLLDFEHPPGDAAERSRLEAVVAALRQPQWLQFPVAAQCQLRRAHVDVEGYDQPVDDPDEPGHHHGEFHAQYDFACARPERLDHLQVLLPQRFPGLHKVIVDVATTSGQDRAEVDAGNARVKLPR